jgi:hypothetical protein
MARYEINGQIYEVPDEVQGERLVQTLTMLSEQTAAPIQQPVQQPEAAPQPQAEEVSFGALSQTQPLKPPRQSTGGSHRLLIF